MPEHGVGGEDIVALRGNSGPKVVVMVRIMTRPLRRSPFGLPIYMVEDHEKIISTIDANRVVDLVAVFQRDPYIHVTQAYRYDSRSLESSWAAIQLSPEYSLRMPTIDEKIFLRPERYWSGYR